MIRQVEMRIAAGSPAVERIAGVVGGTGSGAVGGRREGRAGVEVVGDRIGCRRWDIGMGSLSG